MIRTRVSMTILLSFIGVEWLNLLFMTVACSEARLSSKRKSFQVLWPYADRGER